LVTPVLGAATGTSLQLSGLTASQAVATDASKNLVSIANTGTGNNVLQTSPTLVTPILGVASGTSLALSADLTLAGSTSGVISVKTQAVAGTYNYNLPITAGSSGQVLTSSGGGATAMTWTTPAGYGIGNVGTIWIIKDVKTIGTNGGTFTSGSFLTRTLNTITSYPSSSLVTIGSNRITITSGVYYIRSEAPCGDVHNNATRLYNITDSTVSEIGSSHYSHDTQAISTLETIINIVSTKVYEIQHQCDKTMTTTGFGYATGFQTEVYTMVTITKLA